MFASYHYLMKKITLSFCLIFLTLLGFSLLNAMETTIEARVAAFYHTSKDFRDIYGDWGPSYQIEASFTCDCCYYFWANLSWFHKNGNSTGNDCSTVVPSCNCSGQPSTTVNIANLSLGIKFPCCICEGLIGYFGIGPVFGNIWLKNNISPRETEKTSKFAFGVIAKLGLDYYITQCLFLDLFVDYLYQPVHFHKQIDLGGVQAGIGLGFNF